jgi:hypothetical protein
MQQTSEKGKVIPIGPLSDMYLGGGMLYPGTIQSTVTLIYLQP